MSVKACKRQLILLRSAAKLTFPVLCAFIPLGMALGLVARDMEFWGPALFALSSLVYAGSSEFVALSMFAAGESCFEIVLTSFFINFRHIFYGVSVFDRIPRHGFGRYYVIGALSDETYSILTSLGPKSRDLSTWVAFLNHLYWISGVGLGYVLGGQAHLQIKGIEFCLVALFVVLAIEQFWIIHRLFPYLLAVLTGLFALAFFPGQMVVVAVTLSSIELSLTSKYRAGDQAPCKQAHI